MGHFATYSEQIAAFEQAGFNYHNEGKGLLTLSRKDVVLFKGDFNESIQWFDHWQSLSWRYAKFAGRQFKVIRWCFGLAGIFGLLAIWFAPTTLCILAGLCVLDAFYRFKKVFSMGRKLFLDLR